MKGYKKLKSYIYHHLSPSDKAGSSSWLVDVSLITLILLNVVAIVLESFEQLRVGYAGLFYRFEVFSVIVFSIEYVLRLWTANLDPRYSKRFSGRLRYGITAIALIDLFAVLPFFLPFFGIDLRYIRILRLMRIFRLTKLLRYSKAMNMLNRVLRDKREELIITIVFMLFLLLICSSLMYYVEHEAQPETFSSIPATMWWGIAALTTVGYGDMYPITDLGKVLGGIISIIGIGVFALPAGILASGFSSQVGKEKEGNTG